MRTPSTHVLSLFTLFLVALGLVFAPADAAAKKKKKNKKAAAEEAAQTEEAAAEEGSGKKVIATVDDLPRHTYEVSGTVSELVEDPEQFEALAAAVQADVEAILEEYEVEDRSTRQDLYGRLAKLAYLSGEYQKGLDYGQQVRDLEEKEASKLVAGLIYGTEAEVLLTGVERDSDEMRAAFREAFTAKVEAMPWDVVQDELQSMKGSAEMYSKNLLMGIVQARLDPPVAKAGYLSTDQADSVVGLMAMFEFYLPVAPVVAEVLTEVVNANQVEKEDIWPERYVTFTGDEGYQMVRIGIWDSGVDTAIFTDTLYTNPGETADGTDSDGNGFVDDLHGIAYDVQHNASPQLLYPTDEATVPRDQLEQQIKGMMDLRAAIDSDESTELKKYLGSLQPEEVTPFMENLGLYSLHSHGTHVAGIAVEGNPYAEIVVGRVAFDHHAIPLAYDVPMCERMAVEYQAVVDYFKATDVRAVNMSWGLSLKEIEDSLEANGLGESAEARGTMAREMFAIARDGLYTAMQSAPEILFLVAAGNSDSDVGFNEFIPSSFDLPNVLISGAVDQAGEATSFTSFGETVTVYSNGFEVESYVPGGNRLKFSGTSMASPNTLNLAAKMLAINPELTVDQVIDGIRDGADTIGEEQPLLVIHPAATIEEMLTDR